ncbi:hypothetical protein LINPERPRIM_LOCUS2667 [Linum perenne]
MDRPSHFCCKTNK